MKLCGLLENQQKLLEEKQKIKSNNDLQVMNAKKESEKQKRDKKILYAKIKYILQDEIKNNCDNLQDFNALLYDEALKNKIIDNTIEELQKVLNYKYYSNEFLENINFYIMEIYNTQATKIISIKKKQKKEAERIEKEKAAAEYKKQLLLQYEQIQKEKEMQEQEKQQQQSSIDILAIILSIPFIILIFKILF